MRKALLLLLLIGLLPLNAQAQREVIAWTYHLLPPFIIDYDKQQGLSFDLLDLLNQHRENRGRFHFQLHYLPRKRLDILLHAGSAGLVLWVSPIFFDDRLSKHYRWTSALLYDQQSFLSLAERPFAYHGPESLYGRTLGGVLGHQYQGIQEAIDKGLIQREDVPIDEQNLNKLLSKRINLILIPRSTARYYSRQQGLSEQLYFSPTPLSSYSRQLLLQPSLDADAAAFIQDATTNLAHNPDWRKLLEKYGLD